MSKHMHDNTFTVGRTHQLTSQATDLLLLLGGRELGRDQGREERVFIADRLEKIREDAARRFGMKG